MKRLIMTMAVMALCSCGGGGGGGGGDSVTIPGLYNVQTSVASNTCNFPRENLDVGLRVDQSGPQVVVTAASTGSTFTGTVTSENSFTVSKGAEVPCTPRGVSQEVTTIDFSGIDSDSALVTITEDYGNCTGSHTSACKIVSRGSAQKVSFP